GRMLIASFSNDDKGESNRDQEEGEELTAGKAADQRRVWFAKIFDYDSKNRVTNKKQPGKHAIRLTSACPHQPENDKKQNALEQRLVNLGRMARGEDGTDRLAHFHIRMQRTDHGIWRR